MKKILIIAAAAMFIGTAANAQDVYKQTGGEQNLEVLFTPLGGSPIGINGIKYRKFTSATSAIRANVFLGFSTETTDITLGGSEGETELKTGESSFDISIAPGIESHFVGTDRLSPYVGAELLIGFSNTTDREEVIVDADDNVEELLTKNGSLALGLNGIAGMDFYFADNIYLGAELGFGVLFTTDFDTQTDFINADGDVETDESPNGSSLTIAPNVVGAIRLGFLF